MFTHTLEKEILVGLRTKRELPVSLSKRGEVILLFYYESKKKSEILKLVPMAATTLNRWLYRWEEYQQDREEWLEWYVSKQVTQKEYRSFLLCLLQDAQRPGTPAKFTDEIIEKIVGLAASDPETLGLPFTRWSEVLLKQELIKRKIVPSISTSQIGRFLKRTPHQTTP